jgi:hypothetical protein
VTIAEKIRERFRPGLRTPAIFNDLALPGDIWDVAITFSRPLTEAEATAVEELLIHASIAAHDIVITNVAADRKSAAVKIMFGPGAWTVIPIGHTYSLPAREGAAAIDVTFASGKRTPPPASSSSSPETPAGTVNT